MKDWNYYRENPHTYPSLHDIKEELREAINSKAMTAREREVALNGVTSEANAIWKEKVKPFSEYASKKELEFYEDCRKELGYDNFLNEDGIAALEYKAYQDGHSSGFSEIYGCLIDLAEFAQKIVNCKKESSPLTP